MLSFGSINSKLSKMLEDDVKGVFISLAWPSIAGLDKLENAMFQLYIGREVWVLIWIIVLNDAYPIDKQIMAYIKAKIMIK